MSEAIKTFQTLDSNSIISLIILKGNVSYVLMHFYAHKVSYCDKCCMFQNVLSVIFIKSKMKDRWEMCRDHLSSGSVILSGNCPGVVI